MRQLILLGVAAVGPMSDISKTRAELDKYYKQVSVIILARQNPATGLVFTTNPDPCVRSDHEPRRLPRRMGARQCKLDIGCMGALAGLSALR